MFIYFNNCHNYAKMILSLPSLRFLSLVLYYIIRINTIYIWLSSYAVCKEVPSPPFKAPTPCPSLPPRPPPALFFKSLFLLPYFLFHPLLRYFKQFPHSHKTPSCPNLINQRSWFKLISKG